MAKKNAFHSLRAKLLLALLLAIFFGGGLGILARTTGNFAIGRWYLAPAAVQGRVLGHLNSLRGYVQENNISSTDLEALGRWARDRRRCQITIYGKSTILTADEDGSSLVAYNGMAMQAGPGAEHSSQFPVIFSDGAFSVSIADFSQRHLVTLVNWASFFLGCLVFLLVMLLYNRRVTGQVRNLSRRVRQVSQGDLTLEIPPHSRDEIGDLAQDVDAMRLSIIDKLRREEEAWRANSQLITAISHDVRTPLTTLIGYLDVLAEVPDLSPENRQEYLEICRRKAGNLRELTDELFGYFLVLGTPEPGAELEPFDADTLLQQLLGEYAAEARQRQYIIEERLTETGAWIQGDIRHLQRIFSNLFSNLYKYADPARPILLEMEAQADRIRVAISNGMKADAGRVESTRIGLQTCEKLAAAMGGRFCRHQEKGVFTAEVFLPVIPPPEIEVET